MLKRVIYTLVLLPFLAGCASFGVFKSAGEQTAVCSMSSVVLGELEQLAKLYNVDLSKLVDEWNLACMSASHAGARNPTQEALRRVRFRAFELSKS